MLLVYVIYTNLVTAALSWAKQGLTPAWLGIWWVHIVLAVLVALYFGMGDLGLLKQWGRRMRALRAA